MARARVVASPAAEVQRLADNDIVHMIRDAVAESGVRWTSERATRLFEDIVAQMFRSVIISGSFRLPTGYGTFRMRLHKPTRRRINGELVEVPALPYIRYTEGEVVRVALGKRDHYEKNRKRPVKAAF